MKLHLGLAYPAWDADGASGSRALDGYALAAAAVVASTILGILLSSWVDSKNLILVYVIGVVFTGLRGGSRPAVAASVMSFLSFNFFLTEPRFSFRVAREDELAALVLLFIIALVCGSAASRIRRQFLQLTEAKAERDTARMRAEAEQLRSALLSSVSHDLKTPLATMMGAAESLSVLDAQLAPADRKELADMILDESRRLDSHIQNLLDMTSLGGSDLRIECDWVSLNDVVGAAVKRLKRSFRDIHVDHEASEDELVFIHSLFLEQALFNILENAARASSGPGRIIVSTCRSGIDCVLAIEDDGPGIPVEDREQVFDMFYATAAGGAQKGTGMGLTICRGMIGSLGGSVTVEDPVVLGGARFVIVLPGAYRTTGVAC